MNKRKFGKTLLAALVAGAFVATRKMLLLK